MMSTSDPQQDLIDSTRPNKIHSQSFKLKLIKEQKSQVINVHSTFHKIKRNATNLFNQDLYSDDYFKLEQIKMVGKTNRKISICRLRDIKEAGSMLFGDEVAFNLQREPRVVYPHYPGFVCEMNMLPFWHYETLIEPKYVNEKGFYHVVICKDGRLIKETIDDTFYFDQVFKSIYSPFLDLQSYIWMHIILKVWAKCQGGYSKISLMKPFNFIRTFSYPDWKTLNPILQDIQKFIKQITPIQKRQIIAIAATKNDSNVGFYGLIPDSAAYLVTGHYMEFEALFIRVKALNGSKWNGFKSIQNSPQPEDEIHLDQNQFILPIKEFTNLFHLVHLTTNKFLDKQRIFYTRYSLNLDARESKGKMILFEVNNPPSPTQSTTERQPKDIHYTVNLSLYFPFVRGYDLSRQKIQYQNNESFKIPFCKLMFGRQEETTNLEASFVQSMKQMMLQNEDEDFLYGKSSMQYEWVEGTYFKGYDHSCTFLMKLKPGRYLLRFKIETLRVQYRSNINVVSQTQVRISDPKMDRKQQQQFLKEMLSSKARLQKRNIGYLNPIKKGSWYVCNNDFKSLGYGYLVLQTIKTSQYKIQLKIDPKVLKSCGYKLKDKKDQNKFLVTLQQGQGYTLILKIQDGFEHSKSMPWPPQGIQVTRVLKN